MTKTLFIFIFSTLFFFACKKTTTHQVLLHNESAEPLKVKVYASLPMSKDSFSINSHSDYELFFEELEGLKSNYSCLAMFDSVFTYSATNKMKIKIVANDKYGNLKRDSIQNNSKYEYRCTLYVGKGDTIQ
ncbi:MAG: hypothetical protein ACKOXB_13475 [Flavobacteriales bacterium]